MAKSENSNAGHFYQGSLYGTDGVKDYDEKIKEDPLTQAFLYPAMMKFLEAEIPNKKVLDVGCGPGKWTYQAAKCGAKLVHGFDIQDDMVKLARQATSEYSNVHIKVGNVMKMPYEDDTFEVAMSSYVTCNLPIDVLKCHFTEIYRVLVPGGKAMVINLTKSSFETTLVTCEADIASTEVKINKILSHLPKYPTHMQVSQAFEPLHEILHACFSIDASGSLFHVKSIDQLKNGQAVWNKTPIITFPNYYYEDQLLQDYIVGSGLKINKLESYYTEERRLTYNKTFPNTKLDRTVTKYPRALMYHLLKPSE